MLKGAVRPSQDPQFSASGEQSLHSIQNPTRFKGQALFFGAEEEGYFCLQGILTQSSLTVLSLLEIL